jgi:putative ATP-binding cassette transporter
MPTSAADKPVETLSQQPLELRHDTIWRDAGYLFSLIGRYIVADPLIAPLLIVVGLGSSVVIGYLAIRISVMMGETIDALVSGNAAAGSGALVALTWAIVALIIVQAAMYTARYIFRIRWRTVFTRRLLGQWFDQDRYHRMQRQGRVDNPEQRIQEDLFLVANQITDIIPSLVTMLTSLIFSVIVLYGFSATLDLKPYGVPFSIPSELLTVAVVFGLIWVTAAHFVGRAITRIEIVRQRIEADFRHGLGTVREHGEAIAFERGGPREYQRALGNYELIRINWRDFTIAQIRLLMFNLAVGSLLPRLLPVLLSAPRVLSGAMTAGQVVAVSATFTNVISGITYFATNYAEIAALRAGVARVRMFETELARPVTSQISIDHRSDTLDLQKIAIDLPGGRQLLQVDGIEVKRGDRVLVRGRSGAGKSTLLRVIAGLWPYGTGTVRIPPDASVMFLPQRSYMPDGTLAELLTFPQMPAVADRDRYIAMLQTFSLGNYAGRLDEKAEWRRILSPGEQQRVAIIRVMLRQPDFVFLDEATSALDTELEANLYRALTEALPNAAIVSVAHRPTVEQFHEVAIDVAKGKAVLARLAH